MKSRLHSHLLTGRYQNQALRTFATEVFKHQNWSRMAEGLHQPDKVGLEYETSFRLPSQTFSFAARKAAQEINRLNPQKSILKKRLAHELNSSDQRNLRALKRSNLLNDYSCFNELAYLSEEKKRGSQQSMAFEQSAWHFRKRIQVHPERDMEDHVRVLDQPEEE